MPINDGEDIIFANTRIKESSKKSKLLDLFTKTESFYDEDFPALSDAVCYYKGTDEGVINMASVTEQWIEEGQAKERANTEREKKRADEAEAKAKEARAEADELKEEIVILKEEINILKEELKNLKK